MPSIKRQLESLNNLLNDFFTLDMVEWGDLTTIQKIRYWKKWNAIKSRLKYLRKYEDYELYNRGIKKNDKRKTRR